MNIIYHSLSDTLQYCDIKIKEKAVSRQERDIKKKAWCTGGLPKLSKSISGDNKSKKKKKKEKLSAVCV